MNTAFNPIESFPEFDFEGQLAIAVKEFPDDVIRRYQEENDISLEESKEANIELLKFLTLSISNEMFCSPSKKIDGVWHNFILFTKQYEEFCTKVFGKKIHHHPTFSDGNPVRHMQLYHLTRMRMEMAWGGVNDTFWPDLQAKMTQFRIQCICGGGEGNCMSDCH